MGRQRQMEYRDDLGAAQERIRALEGELVEARAEIARLRHRAAKDAPPAATAPASAAREVRRAGRVHYHPPPTYWPTLRLLAGLVQAARSSAPRLEPLESDSVIGWVLHYAIGVPLTLVGWPLYWLSMGLAILPIAVVTCIAGAVVLLPFLVLSRLTFSPAPPADGSAFLRGEIGAEAARAILWGIAALLVVPMAFSGRLLRSRD